MENDLKYIETRLSKLERDFEDISAQNNKALEMQNEILKEIKAINKTLTDFKIRSVTWDQSSKGFLAMIGLLVVAFFMSVINFFLK